MMLIAGLMFIYVFSIVGINHSVDCYFEYQKLKRKSIQAKVN
jgi:hypothetical protein